MSIRYRFLYPLLISMLAVLSAPALIADDGEPDKVPSVAAATANPITDHADEAAPFALPVFVEPAEAACGSDRSETLDTGFFRCPFGPTCFTDAQCAMVCPIGDGVCAPNFCCWCIVG